MVFAEKTLREVEVYMNLLKKKSRGPVYTNYFKPQVYQTNLLSTLNDEALVFMDRDTDFYRLYFYAINLMSILDLLKATSVSPIVVDYLAKDFSGDVETLFLNAGFEKYAVLIRMINNNLPKFPKTEPLHYAEETEWSVILDMLNVGLDKFTGHFPQQEELLNLIRDKRVIVTRKNNAVTGLFMYQIMNKKCHFYQWYSAKENDPSDGANLLINLYAILGTLGIQLGYLWVDEKNTTVMKIHKRFGFKPDGLKDFIYIKYDK